jgi:addiction module RelB/DinJ family antitoxin
MNKTARYAFRIDREEKSEVFAIFQKLGVTPADALREFFRNIREHRKLPFPVEDFENSKKVSLK